MDEKRLWHAKLELRAMHSLCISPRLALLAGVSLWTLRTEGALETCKRSGKEVRNKEENTNGADEVRTRRRHAMKGHEEKKKPTLSARGTGITRVSKGTLRTLRTLRPTCALTA